MSQHHRRQKWSTHSPKLRAKILPLLPLPCIECGRPVTREMTWDVGHRRAAMDDGAPTAQNTGPAHSSCNRKSGGARGAAVTNARRQQQGHEDKGIRRWF